MTTYTHRYIARIVIEADSGLFVGSGQSSLNKDALVQKDHHGLPMIQGTTLAGVLKHALTSSLKANKLDDIFGFQKENLGQGSRLKVSSAYMLIDENTIAEGLTSPPEHILTMYENLPTRQHVKINGKGVKVDGQLYDNEVVYKGTRFIFELELVGNESDQAIWKTILNEFQSPTFRIGQSTRNGFGKLKISSSNAHSYDLSKEEDFNNYLNLEGSFNTLFTSTEKEKNTDGLSKQSTDLVEYRLELKPDHFFIFSDGLGDEKVNNKPKTERVAFYEDNTIKLKENTLIPGTSIKGAIAHRTAFHFNKHTHQFADLGLGKIGQENDAVSELFGVEDANESKEAQRGFVIFNDIHLNENEVNNEKVFNHVAIDRFTGGAMEGALFSEKVSRKIDKKAIIISLILTKKEFKCEGSEYIKKSLEDALIDICKGLLPLGGMTTKGHGIFTGELFKNGVSLFKYEA